MPRSCAAGCLTRNSQSSIPLSRLARRSQRDLVVPCSLLARRTASSPRRCLQQSSATRSSCDRRCVADSRLGSEPHIIARNVGQEECDSVRRKPPDRIAEQIRRWFCSNSANCSAGEVMDDHTEDGSPYDTNRVTCTPRYDSAREPSTSSSTSTSTSTSSSTSPSPTSTSTSKQQAAIARRSPLLAPQPCL